MLFSARHLAMYGIIALLANWGCQLAERGSAAGASLIGAAWLAEDLEKRGVLDRAQTTIRFDSHERVSGSTGCNSYSASYDLKGHTLRFGAAAATRRACVPALMDQEQRFTRVLEATTSQRDCVAITDRRGGAKYMLTNPTYRYAKNEGKKRERE